MDQHKLAQVQADTVKNFMKKWYTPSRMVIGGLGLDHGRLVEQSEKLFGHLEPDNLPVATEASVMTPYYPLPPKSDYQGGFLSLNDDREDKIGTELPGNFYCFASAFVGFDAPSLLSGRDYYTTSILATLLGTGSSFSSGGPGKGMFSRVYKEILSNGYVESGQHIYNAHTDGGVFGLSLTGYQNYLPRLLELATVGMLRLQSITEEEFQRAKNQLKSQVCTNLEGTHPTLDDLIRQISYYNMRCDYEYHVATIDSITMEETLALVHKMLKTEPSIIVYGTEKARTGLSHDAIRQFIKSNVSE
mgnify:CR=1 FL=1